MFDEIKNENVVVYNDDEFETVDHLKDHFRFADKEEQFNGYLLFCGVERHSTAVLPDFPFALELLYELAESGYSDALFELARMYHTGEVLLNIEKNLMKALECVHKAIRESDWSFHSEDYAVEIKEEILDEMFLEN